MGSLSEKGGTLEWSTSDFHLILSISQDGVVCLRSFTPPGSKEIPSQSSFFAHPDLPLNSVRLAGEGNTADKTAKSLVGSYLSSRLRYESHESSRDAASLTARFDVTSTDSVTGIRVTNHFVAYQGSPVVRFSATITNVSSSPVVVTQLSSMTIGGLTTSAKEWYHDYTLMTATNGWFREAQWREHSLPDIGIDTDGILELAEGHSGSQAIFTICNRGSFSTGSYLPMGLLRRKDGQDTWFWQIEHNGSWRLEIGDFKDSVYLSLGGPTSVDHDWTADLEPGQSFTTVSVAVGRVYADWGPAFQALTDYRRSIRRPHADMESMPIIFNDYMNCLMGDPDEEKIKALLDHVAGSGAQYFVIDAGWYADDSNWWDDVGLWEPSKKRFPSGFKELLDEIRVKKLIPGLWLEPEVVGVRSIVAKDRLPEAAFFHEGGKRIIERGRFQLDYRHPEVIKWMDSVIERLVVGYGAGYFKFDYNIEIIQGTDVSTRSRGAAHLEHQRAYLGWVRGLLDRYPGLVIENCSSGGQRMEYGMLSVHPLQSTSDQQDPVLYAAIAAAVPTAVTPEQSATWAYPQPEWDDEINALTVVNSLLGRIHLSGRLDILKPHQLALVRGGMRVYEGIKHHIKKARPFWPLGLPRWHDEWISLGLLSESGDDAFVSVWRRGGTATEMDLPLPRTFIGVSSVEVSLLYPANFETGLLWKAEEGLLHVTLPDRICARLVHVRK
ncbi:putative Melibiase subfamily [Xylariaceae sp. FL0662B]|nr:putative Melibiase subfamily [Xylariaceae sp. FL0662B]